MGLMFQFIIIARNSCPGICRHQTHCVFPLQNRAAEHTSAVQKTEYFIYYYSSVLLKRARNQKKNEKRNDCFEIWFNLSLSAWPLVCKVQGCNLVKIQRTQTVTEDSFKLISENSKSCNVKFYILIYNKSHGVHNQIEMGSLKVSLKYIPKINSLTRDYQHFNQTTAILLFLII